MTESVKHGKNLKRTGKFLLITGFLLGMVLQFVPDSELNEAMLMIDFFLVIMIIGGAFLFWRGRQYAAKAIAERVIYDSIPDVLYLRAFKTDPSILGYVFSSLLTARLFSGMLSEEEQLSEVLNPFGDLVAIGKPSETLPTPGAARMYASGSEWKKVVTEQMQAARLVVIRADISESLQWEIKKAIQVLNPKNLLILILNMKKKHYEAFRKEAGPVLGETFPKADEIRRFGRISGFIRFSANWKSNFLPLRVPYFRSSVYKPYQRLFKFTLRPVFEEYGLEWQPPPISKLTVSAITVLGIIGLFILFFVATSFF